MYDISRMEAAERSPTMMWSRRVTPRALNAVLIYLVEAMSSSDGAGSLWGDCEL